MRAPRTTLSPYTTLFRSFLRKPPMPIYEYTCEKCGTKIDILQKMDEPAPLKCDQCGELGAMARQVSRTSFVLKGGGWYSDLYGSSKKDSIATTTSPASKS